MKKILYISIHALMTVVLAVVMMPLPVSADENTYTLSGYMTTDDGTPLANINVAAQVLSPRGKAVSSCTDSEGRYSMQIIPGLYRLNPYGDTVRPSGPCESVYEPVAGSRALTSGVIIAGTSESYQHVSITASNVEKNFIIPTAKLTIKALDAQAQPYVNRNAYALYADIPESAVVKGGSDSVSVGSSFLYPRLVDVHGEVSGYVVKGGVFEPGTICVNVSPWPIICNTSLVAITEDMTIVLQPRPSAPGNISIASPSIEPKLSWDEVLGAVSYNIYRNNIHIGTSETNAYSDTTAPEGDNVYYVTTLNHAAESLPSLSKNVLTDRTKPTITHVLSPGVNAHGWSRGSVTASFDCDDELSGIDTCNAPITLHSEGVRQVIKGSATDKAGNSSTTSTEVNIDKTAPVLLAPTWSNNPLQQGKDATLAASATDSLSGVESVTYTINGGVEQNLAFSAASNKWQATFGSKLAAGKYTVTVKAYDRAGNASQQTTTLTVNKASSVQTIIKTVLSALKQLFVLVRGLFG